MPVTPPIAPIVRPITPPSVTQAFQNISSLKWPLLLDSSRQIDASNDRPLGRYSFLMADPFDFITAEVGAANPLAELKSKLSQWKTTTAPDLPPLQGGAAGLFSYDLNQSFEQIPTAAHNAMPIPAIAIGLYDTVIAWDHQQDQAWIISQGFPKTEPDQRIQYANQRIDFFLNQIQKPTRTTNQLPEFNAVESTAFPSPTSPQHPLSGGFPDLDLTSNFTPTDYQNSVQKCVDYIYDGDVFQVNLAQQLRMPARCASVEFYLRLRSSNPAPFSGYFDFSVDGFAPTQIISSSPERLISVRDRSVETRPIKGTRPRTGQPLVDIYAREKLQASEKDIAENTMIVDLMRNDLARVCDDHSVRVEQLCQMEEYASVMHLVSSVTGRLQDRRELTDLLAAIFPGGSITGAPKVRAMEIIAELEPDARGAYCGSLGYLGFDGNADLNILIRTVTAQSGWWQIPVGGGIVSHSNPKQEYDETWTKASAILNAAIQQPKCI